MFSIFKTLLGSDDIINAGGNLIDDAFYTDSEKAADKALAKTQANKAKVDLLTAYHPFKKAQRYFMLVMLFNFTLSFIIGLLIFLGNLFIDVNSFLRFFINTKLNGFLQNG